MKYNETLINSILCDLDAGMTVAEVAKKYSINVRRVYEFKGRRPKTSPVVEPHVASLTQIKDTDSLIEKSLTYTGSTPIDAESLLLKNGLVPSEWEVTSFSHQTWVNHAGHNYFSTKLTAIKTNVTIEFNLPAPVVPTRAIVWPAGICKSNFFKTTGPEEYLNSTPLK